MRIAVIGALGGLGANVVRDALARGHRVRALVRRDPPFDAPAGVDWVRGDAHDVDTVAALVRGCDALAHCANVNIGPTWANTVLGMLDTAIAGCRRHDTKLVFPANVWVFGRGRPGERVDEQVPFSPCSDKGRVRAEQERRIRVSGIRHVMVRLPEFYGPHVVTLTGPMFRAALRGDTVRWFGDLDAEVEFVFMPDGARALVEVAAARGIDRDVFHLPGATPTTPRALLGEAIRQAGSASKLRALPPWLVRTAGVFAPKARAFADILHLWEHPIVLDGGKYRAQFGELPATPYDDGIAHTLAWLREHIDVPMYY